MKVTLLFLVGNWKKFHVSLTIRTQEPPATNDADHEKINKGLETVPTPP